MKKFLKFVGEIKTWGCLCFTGCVCIYTFIGAVLGGESMRYSLIWQMLAMCGVITVLQYIFFSGNMLKKPSYYVRLMLFCGLVFCVCAGFAWACGWFPMDSAGAWAAFVGIFFAAFMLFCLGFEIYFRALGQRYDACLGRAQKKQGRQ